MNFRERLIISALAIIFLSDFAYTETNHDMEGSHTDKEMSAKSPVPSPAKKIKHWVAPMDPTYISDKPGKSPMGMDLVPVYEMQAKEPNEVSDSNSKAIVIDPIVVQNMGVRIAKARRGSVLRHVRTIGEVEVAEDKISVINLRFSGWIEKIWADQTEKMVSKGEKLFQIYSPELITAQEEFLLAVKSNGPNSPLAQAARKRLLLWEIPNSHIDYILESGNGQSRMVVRAPRKGYILHKNVVLGAQVKAGVDLYRIGDLQKIWVKAEVYEYDAPWISLNQPARMSLSFQAGRSFEGKVSFIHPTLNSKSRTLSVRLEFENPGLNLKPGMFATVHIQAQTKEDVLTVPTEAILHSGQRQLVFISPEIGRYEPREVTTGLVGDNRATEILSGLNGGEDVVVSGQFLLDSESQLQEAVQKMLRARLQAKSVKKQTKEAGIEKSSYYYTCSMHPQIVQDEPGTCPICGMNLVKKKKQK